METEGGFRCLVPTCDLTVDYNATPDHDKRLPPELRGHGYVVKWVDEETIWDPIYSRSGFGLYKPSNANSNAPSNKSRESSRSRPASLDKRTGKLPETQAQAQERGAEERRRPRSLERRPHARASNLSGVQRQSPSPVVSMSPSGQQAGPAGSLRGISPHSSTHRRSRGSTDIVPSLRGLHLAGSSTQLPMNTLPSNKNQRESISPRPVAGASRRGGRRRERKSWRQRITRITDALTPGRRR